MSFCRITGKSRGLPKPNYFPLLPPISPADAKRFCRITGKAYGLPSHHFVPVILTAFHSANKCRITNVTEDLGPHHYVPEISYGQRKHIHLTDYKYVFPIFDENDDNQKDLLTILNSKQIKDKLEYCYKVDEQKCTLVFSAKLEAAVRDGDVRDVMLAKNCDSILLKMKKGNISLELQDFEGDKEQLFEGEGPRLDVLKQREKEEMLAKKKRKRNSCDVTSRIKIFQEKEQKAEVELVEEHEIKLEKNSKRRKSTCTKESLKKSKIVNGHHQETSSSILVEKMGKAVNSAKENVKNFLNTKDPPDILMPVIETWDWVTYEKQILSGFCKPTIKKLPKPCKIPPKLVKLQNITEEISEDLLEETAGFDTVPYVEPLLPHIEQPNPVILEGIKHLPEEKLEKLTDLSEKIINSPELFENIPTITEVHESLQNFQNGKPATISDVPGLKVDIDATRTTFLTGEYVSSPMGEVFVPGRVVSTPSGLVYQTGLTVKTPEGPSFIPGFVFNQEEQHLQGEHLIENGINSAAYTTFVAGQFQGETFVPGQTMLIDGPEKKFIDGQTIVTPDGLKFVPGVIDESSNEFIAGQKLHTASGVTFYPGQTMTENERNIFIPGQSVLSKENGWEFLPGQIVENGEKCEFIPGKCIISSEGSKFIAGQDVENVFVPGKTIEKVNGDLEFVPGLNVETRHGPKFVEGQVMETKYGEIFIPGKTTSQEDGTIEMMTAKSINEVVFADPVSSGIIIDTNNCKLLEQTASTYGTIIRTEEGIEFYPDRIEKRNLPKGRQIPGKLVKQNNDTKFVPGIVENDEFIPGQVVRTETGEKFIPGQVIETSEGLKFVPGQVVQTKAGSKFLPGQTVMTEHGPRFVPGQIVQTKAGPTFIPGQVIYTEQEGERFVPGQVVDTDFGPRFVPGQVLETDDKVTFIPGQIVQTAEGPKFVAPDLMNNEYGDQQFSVQTFTITPEELMLLKPRYNHQMQSVQTETCTSNHQSGQSGVQMQITYKEGTDTNQLNIDSKMLRQLTQSGILENGKFELMTVKSIEDILPVDSVSLGLRIEITNRELLEEKNTSAYVGTAIYTEKGIEFYPDKVEKCDLPKGTMIPGQLIKQNGSLKFIPGITENEEFIPGQIIQTETGEKFIPGQVIETHEGVKFVPGKVVHTKSGDQFVPGQTILMENGPIFVPGQVIQSKSGPTFIPGKIICTEQNGERFVPGQIIDTNYGSLFVPGQVVETSNEVNFIPGQIIETSDGPKFVPPNLINNKFGDQQFSAEVFSISPEELRILKSQIQTEKYLNSSSVETKQSKAVDEIDINSEVLHQLSQVGKVKGENIKLMTAKCMNEAIISDSASLGIEIGADNYELLENNTSVYGIAINTEEGIKFYSEETDKSNLPKGTEIPGKLIKENGITKFIPGIIENEDFTPGQIIQTEIGEKFIPGQVVNTSEGLKFVPGKVVETKFGSTFLPGQTVITENGPTFVPGQMVQTKFGSTFIPGKIICTKEEGECFIPGQIVNTCNGPQFNPGQVVETGEEIIFIPGQIMEIAGEVKCIAPSLINNELENHQFSAQALNITPEELIILKTHYDDEMQNGENQSEWNKIDEIKIDTKVLRQLSEIGGLKNDKINVMVSKSMNEVVLTDSACSGIKLDINNCKLLEETLPGYGIIVETTKGFEFYPDGVEQHNLPEGTQIPGKLVKQNGNSTFIPGIIENEEFIPGQNVPTENGEKFISGQVIQTNEGLKFVPGKILQTSSGSKFLPGQTVTTENGLVFVPGQMVQTKAGATFIPGKIIYTEEEGEKFVPGQVINTNSGPRFVPGQIFESGDKVTFVPGKIEETLEGIKFTAPNLIINKFGDPQLLDQVVTVTPEELTLLRSCNNESQSINQQEVTHIDEINFDSKMLHQLSEIGLLKDEKIKIMASKSVNEVIFHDSIPPGIQINTNNYKLLKQNESAYGMVFYTEKGIEFYPEETDKSKLPTGAQISGKLINENGKTKFIPGTIENEEFTPGQIVQTETGEKFIPGQVIETNEGLKFVPGKFVQTKSGSKFLPGQTVITENGPTFVPGQVVETKSGLTFIPGKIICTKDEGDCFVPGQVVNTSCGPRFVPAQIFETDDKITFVPGEIVESAEGPKFFAPKLVNNELEKQQFSTQSLRITPEESILSDPRRNRQNGKSQKNISTKTAAHSGFQQETAYDEWNDVGELSIDSKMLRQLSEAGMSIGRQIETPVVDIVLQNTINTKLVENLAQRLGINSKYCETLHGLLKSIESFAAELTDVVGHDDMAILENLAQLANNIYNGKNCDLTKASINDTSHHNGNDANLIETDVNNEKSLESLTNHSPEIILPPGLNGTINLASNGQNQLSKLFLSSIIHIATMNNKLELQNSGISSSTTPSASTVLPHTTVINNNNNNSNNKPNLFERICQLIENNLTGINKAMLEEILTSENVREELMENVEKSVTTISQSNSNMKILNQIMKNEIHDEGDIINKLNCLISNSDLKVAFVKIIEQEPKLLYRILNCMKATIANETNLSNNEKSQTSKIPLFKENVNIEKLVNESILTAMNNFTETQIVSIFSSKTGNKEYLVENLLKESLQLAKALDVSTENLNLFKDVLDGEKSIALILENNTVTEIIKRMLLIRKFIEKHPELEESLELLRTDPYEARKDDQLRTIIRQSGILTITPTDGEEMEIKTSNQIPLSILCSDNQLAVEDFFLRKRTKTKEALVIVKKGFQAVIPRELCRDVLLGKCAYSVLDENGIRHFEPIHVLNAFKGYNFAKTHQFSMYSCDYAQSTNELNENGDESQYSTNDTNHRRNNEYNQLLDDDDDDDKELEELENFRRCSITPSVINEYRRRGTIIGCHGGEGSLYRSSSDVYRYPFVKGSYSSANFPHRSPSMASILDYPSRTVLPSSLNLSNLSSQPLATRIKIRAMLYEPRK